MTRLAQLASAVTAVAIVTASADQELPPIKSKLEDPKGNFHLYISNQSFAITPVDIRVAIDGTPLLQKYFAVGNQHNLTRFAFKLSAGQHKLTATSTKGAATLEKTFEVKDTLAAVLNYWYYPTGTISAAPTPRQFSFHSVKEPVGID